LRYRSVSDDPVNGPGELIYKPGFSALGQKQFHPGPWNNNFSKYKIQGASLCACPESSRWMLSSSA
ncbi:MAG: hypothetical protein MUP17_05755, partial [candidate division Zixibacteria bacterium]|nr:hypothetical protein [candidate division Zixibacteria bacterium]